LGLLMVEREQIRINERAWGCGKIPVDV